MNPKKKVPFKQFLNPFYRDPSKSLFDHCIQYINLVFYSGCAFLISNSIHNELDKRPKEIQKAADLYVEWVDPTLRPNKTKYERAPFEKWHNQTLYAKVDGELYTTKQVIAQNGEGVISLIRRAGREFRYWEDDALVNYVKEAHKLEVDNNKDPIIHAGEKYTIPVEKVTRLLRSSDTES